MGSGEWKALGHAVKARRKELGLTQVEVTERGGPSRETIRLLELGDRNSYRPATFMQLDAALEWQAGTARSIVEGRADLSDPRSWVAEPQHHEATVTDEVPVAEGRVVHELIAGRSVNPLTQALLELRRLENPTPTEERIIELVTQALELAWNELSY